MKTLDDVRSWLISKGVPAEELDNVEPATIKIDVDNLGNTVLLSLVNTDVLGEMVMMQAMEIEELKLKIAELEGSINA